MTFSNPEVAAYVNANFVSAWHNRGPGFFNTDPNTERWIFASSMEAYPTRNVCTFFLAPDGKVFSYVAGFYSPDLFLKFLKNAVDVRTALYDAKMAPKTGGLDAARAIHEKFALTAERSAEKIGEMSKRKDGWRKALADYRIFTYQGKPHQHSSGCVHHLVEGLDYVAKLHWKWSDTAELPDLQAIRYSYLWGNSFTEEVAGATPLEGENADTVSLPKRNVQKVEGTTTRLGRQGLGTPDLFGGTP